MRIFWLRFFLKLRAVDRFFVETRATLEVGVVVEAVLGGRLFGDFERADQRRVGGDELERAFVVFLDVGPKVEATLRLERSDDVGEEGLVEYASLAMPPFPPGVGEIDVDGS